MLAAASYAGTSLGFSLRFYVVPFTPARGKIASHGRFVKKSCRPLPRDTPRLLVPLSIRYCARDSLEQLRQEFVEPVDVYLIHENINDQRERVREARIRSSRYFLNIFLVL